MKKEIMKFLKPTILLVVVGSMLFGCFEDNDDNQVFASEISDFVWKGMNAVYLYKANIPDLANDRFTTNEEFADYLNGFGIPNDLFESVIYQRETIDRFSVLVSDFIALEQLFSGVSKSNGMEFGLVRIPNNATEIFGYVRYILPNTSAEDQGLQRGIIFNAVDGTTLTDTNFRDLLFGSNDTYSISLATYNDNGTSDTSDDTIESGTETISLTKTPYTENPILMHSVLNVDGENVGYLMYNGFTGTNEFDSQLNAVFAEFNAAGITDLVLDLRYNGGGSVSTAIWLSSMITGQFTGDLFTREEWNPEIQTQFEADNPNALLNPFVDEMIKQNTSGDITFQQTINHVNLNRVYVITTGSTASASELVINGLDPYIDVIQVGTTSVGKYQASITIYDSPDFRRADANPGHTFAIQPLVLKSINSVGFTDFDNGFIPEIILAESFANLGVLGNINEPLLAEALANIQGLGRNSNSNIESLEVLFDSNDATPFAKEMYSDKQLPSDLKLFINE